MEGWRAEPLLVSSTGSFGNAACGDGRRVCVCSAQRARRSLGCWWVKSSLHRAEEPALPLLFKPQSWRWPTVKTNQAVTFDLDSNNNVAMSTFSEISQLIYFAVIVRGALGLLAGKSPALSPFQFAKPCADTCTVCVCELTAPEGTRTSAAESHQVWKAATRHEAWVTSCNTFLV